jgi:hypothetical protein
MVTSDVFQQAWVQNQGASCTTASVLAGLQLLGAPTVPDLGLATVALGAPRPYAAPSLWDYLPLPGRGHLPLDRHIEDLAAEVGLKVRSRTSWALPGMRLRPVEGEILIVNLVWGQERPGVYGTWGWHPLKPATYQTGGHSAVLVRVEGSVWVVLDPNHPDLQRWPRPGLVLTATRIRRRTLVAT